MKKLLALSLLVSSVVVAGHEEGVRWGVGARAGVATFAGKIKSNMRWLRDDNNPPTTLLQETCKTIKPGAFSFQGGAFAEVGYRSCNWSYGALVDVNGDTLSSVVTKSLLTNNTNDREQRFCYTVKAPLHIGADIRGGHYFGDALWYGLVGVEGIRMRYNHYISDAIFTADAANPVIVGYDNCGGFDNCSSSCNTSCDTSSCDTNRCNNSFWRAALRVGTGVEYMWSDCFNVKLEYRFILAGKKCLGTVASDIVNLNNNNNLLTNTDTLYFRQSVTALMLSYQF